MLMLRISKIDIIPIVQNSLDIPDDKFENSLRMFHVLLEWKQLRATRSFPMTPNQHI